MLPRFLPLTINTMSFSLSQFLGQPLFCPTHSYSWFNEPSGGGARAGLADVADKYCKSASVWCNCEFDAKKQSYNRITLQQSISLTIRTSEWQQGPAALVACLTSLLWLIIAINKIILKMIFTLTRKPDESFDAAFILLWISFQLLWHKQDRMLLSVSTSTKGGFKVITGGQSASLV